MVQTTGMTRYYLLDFFFSFPKVLSSREWDGMYWAGEYVWPEG